MEAQQTSPYADLEKASGLFSGTPEQAQSATDQANNDVLKWLMYATAAGLLGRSAVGMSHLMQRDRDTQVAPSYQPVDVQLPAPEEEEEKFASDIGDAFKRGYGNVEGWLRDALPWGSNWFWGEGATEPWGIPAYYPLVGGAAIGGGYGGWKLADMMADWGHKQQRKDELARAQEEYEQLLQETMAKHGSDDVIEQELEELADLVTEKQANLGTPSDWLGAGTGAWTLYAILAALGSGKLTYDYFKQRNQADVTEEALRRRAKERTGGVAPAYLQANTGM